LNLVAQLLQFYKFLRNRSSCRLTEDWTGLKDAILCAHTYLHLLDVVLYLEDELKGGESALLAMIPGLELNINVSHLIRNGL
jgi:hypothetical protein